MDKNISNAMKFITATSPELTDKIIQGNVKLTDIAEICLKYNNHQLKNENIVGEVDTCPYCGMRGTVKYHKSHKLCTNCNKGFN